MGDTTRVQDTTCRAQQAADQATCQLRETAYTAMAQNGRDRINDQSKATSTRTFDNPYDHINLAGAAIRELESLQGKNANDTIQVSDGQGHIRQVTVGARETELLKTVQSQFTAAISAADRIDGNGLQTKLRQLYAAEKQTTDPTQLASLQQQQAVFESMKHAPSVGRFAYATFLADHLNFAAAKPLLDQAARLDPEARSNQLFRQVSDMVNQQLRGQQSGISQDGNPLVALDAADQKAKAGDAPGAEAAFKKALDLASKVDPKVVQQNLQQIEQAKQQNAGNQAALTQLIQQEQAWMAMAHATSLVKMDYADFLISQKRQKEAQDLLTQVKTNDGAFVQASPEFLQLQAKAGAAGQQTFDDPFEHLKKFQDLYNKNDQQGARKELDAAMAAAGGIDRNLMKSNMDAIDQQLKVETDPTKKQDLQQLRQVYESLYHADAFTKVCMARYDLAQHNYNAAHSLLEAAQKEDPDFTKKPELKFNDLMDAAHEPSTWEKVWGFTKGILKNLVCDGAAIVAGFGAGLLLSETGPGAIVGGAAAGAATYTLMHKLMGDEVTWTTPLWGALDGATGGAAALARTALVSVGGQLVTKEAAAEMAAKTGADLTGITATEGTLAYGKAAQEAGAAALKNMGKDLPMWTRLTSRIPFSSTLGLGDAAYSQGVSALRNVALRNLAGNAIVNAGTVGTASLVYRGGHDAYTYATGGYTNFGDFAKAYAGHVVGDTVRGTTIGTFSSGLGTGLIASGITNGGREALFGNHNSVWDWAAATGMNMGIDTVAGTIPGMVSHGPVGWTLNRLPVPGLTSSIVTGYNTALPVAYPTGYEAFMAYLKSKAIEQQLQTIQAPVTSNDQIQMNYFQLPGTDNYPQDPNQ